MRAPCPHGWGIGQLDKQHNVLVHPSSPPPPPKKTQGFLKRLMTFVYNPVMRLILECFLSITKKARPKYFLC